MGTVLWAVGIGVAAFVAVSVLFVRSLRHSNRVGVRGKSSAPLRWLFDPCWSARLHRRLRRVVASVRPWLPRRRRHEDAPPIAQLAQDIELHAVALDRDIVVASRAPKSHRRLMLIDLTEQVISLENLTSRVVTLGSAQHQLNEPTREAIARMNMQLDALEEAHDEIARLEAALGWESRPQPDPGRDTTA